MLSPVTLEDFVSKVIPLLIKIFNYDVGNEQDQEDDKKWVEVETSEENLTISQTRANSESDVIILEARDQNVVATEADVGAPAEKEKNEFDMKMGLHLKKRSGSEKRRLDTVFPGFHLRSIVHVSYGVIG